MALLGAESFHSHVDQLRTVAIAGAKGSGKDLLAFELAEYFLKRDYKFTSNQENVWNDPYFTTEYLNNADVQSIKNKYIYDEKQRLCEIVPDNISMERMLFGDDVRQTYTHLPVKPKERRIFDMDYGKDDKGWFRRVPDMRKRVIVLSEGGRYLRKWVYFENMYEFTRKTDNYIIIPSIRLPHEDLCEMIVTNVVPFRIFGILGGVWKWRVSGAGLSKPIEGKFIQTPPEVGIYDTYDFTTSPTEAIEWFERQIDYIVKNEYGRNGLSSMESGSSENENDSLARLSREFESVSLSLQNKKR